MDNIEQLLTRRVSDRKILEGRILHDIRDGIVPEQRDVSAIYALTVSINDLESLKDEKKEA